MRIQSIGVACALALLATCEAAHGAPGSAQVAAGFRDPPDDARILMRWWWFGPAVSKPELQREIRAMKAGGIGGFEIQPVYPLTLDDPTSGLRNLPYLSDEFIGGLRYAAEQARAEHLRIDLTLGSGSPFGGPHIPVTQAAAMLRMFKTALAAGESSVAVPQAGLGEKLLRVYVAIGAPDLIDTSTLRELPLPRGPRMAVPAAEHGALERNEARERKNRDGRDVSRERVAGAKPVQRTVLFFMATRTGQQVKRAAVGAEGFVLDHFSHTAVLTHLQTVGERLLGAFGTQPPRTVFSDSLEVHGADWTDDLPEEFNRRRGYDLLPHLPALFFDKVPGAAEIRHDWGRTLTELVEERYLAAVNEWAQAKGTRFRSQTYGLAPVILSSNALVALPEGEGSHWRGFSPARWASSAGHLYGRGVISAEAWTALHSLPFRATPLDMKADADTLFLQGINQLVGHGWPYTPPAIPAPGWSFHAAAVLSDQNPWWPVMPEVARYLQRLSYLLRQGEPVTDVAILLPSDDAWAATRPGHASVSGEMSRFVTDALTAQVLDSGYAFDYIDAAAIQKLGIKHRALVLPSVTRIDPAVLRRIQQHALNGGVLIAIGEPPSLGAGYQNMEEQRRQVQEISKALFGQSVPRVRKLAKETDLGAALRELLEPDLQPASPQSAIGFVHRRLADADVYFVANTGPQPVKLSARFRDARGRPAQWWNPLTGAARVAESSRGVRLGKVGKTPGPAEYVLDLAPYQSRVLVFGASNEGPAAPERSGPGELVADVSKDWELRFDALNITRHTNLPASWTEDEATRYYSGIGVYRRSVDLPAAASGAAPRRLMLEFGVGTAVAPDPKEQGGHALLDSPVREAVEVFINGNRAGSVWAPPYELDVTNWLHAGPNQLELRVGNLAINALAARAPVDYRLLNARYGVRFVPETGNLRPLPAGLLGPVTLQAVPLHGKR